MKEKKRIPWSKFLTSLPVIGTVAIHLADNWATLALTALGPMYVARVLQFNVKSVSMCLRASYNRMKSRFNLHKVPRLVLRVDLCWILDADFKSVVRFCLPHQIFDIWRSFRFYKIYFWKHKEILIMKSAQYEYSVGRIRTAVGMSAINFELYFTRRMPKTIANETDYYSFLNCTFWDSLLLTCLIHPVMNSLIGVPTSSCWKLNLRLRNRIGLTSKLTVFNFYNRTQHP